MHTYAFKQSCTDDSCIMQRACGRLKPNPAHGRWWVGSALRSQHNMDRSSIIGIQSIYNYSIWPFIIIASTLTLKNQPTVTSEILQTQTSQFTIYYNKAPPRTRHRRTATEATSNNTAVHDA